MRALAISQGNFKQAQTLTACIILVCAATILCGCRILPIKDLVLDEAKPLKSAERATITASGNSGGIICLRSLNGENLNPSGGFLGVPTRETYENLANLQEFRIVAAPGRVELGLLLTGWGGWGKTARSGVLNLTVEAKAGKNYFITARVTKRPDGSQSWEPVVTEK